MLLQPTEAGLYCPDGDFYIDPWLPVPRAVITHAHVDAFVRAHTVEKFGPVRAVTPLLVFELGFEAIQRSSRHKSGIAVRFPRILRWRRDKSIGEADSLENIRALVPE